MHLPFYSYMPIVAGLIGAHYYKKYRRKKGG